MNKNIREHLLSLEDKEYKSFHTALMPTIDPDTVIGIRIPVLREYAGVLIKEGRTADFLNDLPHKYYEENNLHAFIIAELRDFDSLSAEIERFLPFVDNWATCDSLRPAAFGRNKEKLLDLIKKWLQSDKEFTVRFAVEMLMIHFLKEDFSEEYLRLVSEIKSDKYYINMMCAWFFAEALYFRYDAAVLYFTGNKLTDFVHNKAINKACESRKISDGIKAELRTLRRKN